MLSYILNSPRAIPVNIEIMRTFVRLRRLLTTSGRSRTPLTAHPSSRPLPYVCGYKMSTLERGVRAHHLEKAPRRTSPSASGGCAPRLTRPGESLWPPSDASRHVVEVAGAGAASDAPTDSRPTPTLCAPSLGMHRMS